MKVICDGLDLSDAVLKVSKALAIKSPNPIYESIKIIAKGDNLTLIATDLELTIEKTIKADVLMEGETLVVGKYFVEFVKKLENEQVELSQLYDSQLQIKYSDNESELQIYPVEEFPILERNQDKYFTIKQNEFKKLVESTVIACAVDDARPILKGCLFDIKDNGLTAVALDGFRMAVAHREVESNGDIKAVIPAKTLTEITRLLSDSDEKIKININDNLLFVEFEDTLLASRLIEGEFVKYSHILPTTFQNVITVNKNALLSSIDRASIVGRNDRYNVVKFDVKENTMVISSKSEVGNVNENINVTLSGKDIAIAFNSKYVADYLKITNEEFVNLNLNSPIDPCVITPVGSDEFLYLVLPVRINA